MNLIIAEMLKRGDRVLVWSLQSFHYGGFLKGEPAFVRQNQNTGDSVILCVIRNKRGVYVQQVVKVKKKDWNAEKRLKKFRKKIMKNQFGIRKWESI